MSQEIVVDFLENGEVKMEGKGFTGRACVVEMEFLKKALGETKSVKYKSEYHKQGVTDASRIRAR